MGKVSRKRHSAEFKARVALSIIAGSQSDRSSPHAVILFRKGLDPRTLPFQNARKGPNGMQKMPHPGRAARSTPTEL
jgi:hypothetical protein